jgi:hypothetical protein
MGKAISTHNTEKNVFKRFVGKKEEKTSGVLEKYICRKYFPHK